MANKGFRPKKLAERLGLTERGRAYAAAQPGNFRHRDDLATLLAAAEAFKLATGNDVTVKIRKRKGNRQ